jgi:hypothetical protein
MLTAERPFANLGSKGRFVSDAYISAATESSACCSLLTACCCCAAHAVLLLQGYDRQERAAAGRITAGNPNSALPQFNIITGGAPLTNYTFEAWEKGHDYRKTR